MPGQQRRAARRAWPADGTAATANSGPARDRSSRRAAASRTSPRPGGGRAERSRAPTAGACRAPGVEVHVPGDFSDGREIRAAPTPGRAATSWRWTPFCPSASARRASPEGQSRLGQDGGVATDLTQCTATELLELYRRARRRRSRRHGPCSSASSALDPTLNAFCLVAGDEAMASARRARCAGSAASRSGRSTACRRRSRTSILTGAGRRGGAAAPSIPDQPWDVDAPATARLREAGAVLVGKTTTPEFGCKGETNSALTGITRNPWDPTQDARRVVGRHGGRRRRRARPAQRRDRRRRLGAHPGRVLRQRRAQAELRAGAGVPAVAVRHGVAPRAAHDERRRRGADAERAEAARRPGLDVAAARRPRLPRRARRRHRRAARRLLADARLRRRRRSRGRRRRRRGGRGAGRRRCHRRGRRPGLRRPAGDHDRAVVHRGVDAVEHARRPSSRPSPTPTSRPRPSSARG